MIFDSSKMVGMTGYCAGYLDPNIDVCYVEYNTLGHYISWTDKDGLTIVMSDAILGYVE